MSSHKRMPKDQMSVGKLYPLFEASMTSGAVYPKVPQLVEVLNY